MSAAVQTIITIGAGGLVVDTECHLSNGLPGIIIVGLGNKAVDEAKERIRSAFASSQIPLPRKRITINLAPADVPKDSTSLDLSIAAAILQTDSQCAHPLGKDCAIIGELGLRGDLRAVRGIIGKLLHGKKHGISRFFVPVGNLQQALLVPGVQLVALKSVQELYAGLTGQIEYTIRHTGSGLAPSEPPEQPLLLLSEVAGQARAKRALEIAAAGGHNIFLSGPPGVGKSMLAKALPSILPPLSQEEMLEITQLHSLVAGDYDRLITVRPFRAPHHSASHVAIVGGGNRLRPGEITLAHRGVLLLDELPEFGRSTIEALRQPLEDRIITVARAKDTAIYPADFIMIATANPCPCGFFGTAKDCSCPAYRIAQYRQKLSGPIMDRIDLYVDVEEIDHAKLLNDNPENDDLTRERVARARAVQARRYRTATRLNADMTNRDIHSYSRLESDTQTLLNTAAAKIALSARSYMRVIKIARTIADLGNSRTIKIEHMAEALQYRIQTTPTLEAG